MSPAHATELADDLWKWRVATCGFMVLPENYPFLRQIMIITFLDR